MQESQLIGLNFYAAQAVDQQVLQGKRLKRGELIQSAAQVDLENLYGAAADRRIEGILAAGVK